jgi:HSP20 family molecular chaperone IbpA
MAQERAVEKHTSSEVPAREMARGRRTYIPSVDIVETNDELVVYADMPGVGADNVDIHFENGELAIFGKVLDRQRENQSYLHREYGVGDFQRVFSISETIDAEKISAEYSHGVLTLRLPKVEAARPRKIAVKAK